MHVQSNAASPSPLEGRLPHEFARLKAGLLARSITSSTALAVKCQHNDTCTKVGREGVWELSVAGHSAWHAGPAKAAQR